MDLDPRSAPQRVRSYLAQYDLAQRWRHLELSSATVPLAAKALGVEEARIAKSLALQLPERLIVIVCAGDVKIANPLFKGFFQAKAQFLTPAQTQERLGFAVGGVCPFALPEGVATYLDRSLERWPSVFTAGGGSQSIAQFTPSELAQTVSNFAGWIEVTRPLSP